LSRYSRCSIPPAASPPRAVAWLEALSATGRGADVPEAKADLLHAIYERIVVTGRTIVSIRLTPSAYAHGLALALPEKVAPERSRADVYSSGRIGAAATLTLVLDVAVGGYDISPGTLLPLLSRIRRGL
jgi:hypothetical protein